jgi:hypothetical protein
MMVTVRMQVTKCYPELPMEYNDGVELTRYVWDHYGRLMTEFERRVGAAIIHRLKLARAGRESNPIARRWGALDDPEVNAALADGPEVYRRRVCDRVLAESGGEVFINRCPACGRVVRTPKARQCFWCGYDWH